MSVLKFGDRGTKVGDAQQALLEAGFTLSHDELANSLFGQSMLDDIKAFQTAARLTVDGILGPETMGALLRPSSGFVASGWRYDANMVPQYVRPATDAAVSQIGEFEKPPHSNQVAGNRYGNGTDPWCAYFVSWCFSHLDKSPFGLLTSAYKLTHWGQNSGKIIPPYNPVQGGDIFTILRQDLHGHTGLVVGVLADGRLCCVEGNAGDAVRATVRKRDGLTLIRAL